MRVPLSWLREYVDIDLSPEALAERLTLLGMEVKGIERIGTDWHNVVVGELLEVAPHPNSAKLSLTKVRVDDSGAAPLSIVCGATNIAAGQHVPVALPGSVLPGGRRIEVSRIAGEESNGMLCSGDELRLTSDADGILILPEDTPIGSALADVLGDTVLDVDVKPNRGDALSIVGLAREVAAATGATLRWPEISVDESGDQTSAHVQVDVQDVIRCSRFVARYLDGVTVAPSPVDVQRRLMAAGQRPVSNVVDASNYVMLELGKPIHTFDATAVSGGRIIVRGANAGEKLETLDHVVRELDPDVLVIADERGAIGIAGVMGGAASEVSDGTTAVIVESAIFDPVSIRRTAFRYGLRSEASLRFEKGQEHRLARIGADRATQLILQWAGGRAAVGVVDTDRAEPVPSRLPFRPARVSRLLGVYVPRDEQRSLLERVEIRTEPATAEDEIPIAAGEATLRLADDQVADALVALVPTHRRDLQIEPDIAEEVARVRGYETLTGALPASQNPPYRRDPRRDTNRLRTLLSGRGLSEVVTFALISASEHERIGIAAGDRDTIRAANPVSADHVELRRSMLPGLLRVLVDNERQRREDVRIFELGHVHQAGAGGPIEAQRLAILLAGAASPPSYLDKRRDADLADLQGLVAAVVERLIPGAVVWFDRGTPRPGLDHPGRTSVAKVSPPGVGSTEDAIELGPVSELHPRLLESFEVRTPHAVVADLNPGALLAAVPAQVRASELDRLPAQERDIAIVVPASTAAGAVTDAIHSEAGQLLSGLWLFDRYRGAPLAHTEVSLAYRLRFQPQDRALSDEDLDGTIERVVRVLAERYGARLRD